MNLSMPFALAALSLAVLPSWAAPADFVDPHIGTDGAGNTVIGPSMPYGMVKPSPAAPRSVGG